MTQMNEVAAQIMEHLCNHDWHGYSQGARWGDGEGTCEVDVDGYRYYVEQGDRDCSSAIISSYQAAGLDVNATYTGNMKSGFLDTGMFEWHGMDFTAQRGDIYLNEACHTAMCTCADPDLLAEFSISETGGIYGETGDQTGAESHICNYYSYPWNGILHFTGGEARGGVPINPEPAQPEDKRSDFEKELDNMTLEDIANAVWTYRIPYDGDPNANKMDAWQFQSWTNHDTAKISNVQLEDIERKLDELERKIDDLSK